MNEDQKNSIIWVQSPKLSNNLTDTIGELFKFLVLFAINILTIPIHLLIIYLRNKKPKNNAETTRIQEEFVIDENYKQYNDQKSMLIDQIDSVQELQEQLELTVSSSAFGYKSELVCEYFLFLNKLLKRYYQDKIDSEDLSKNLIYGARLIMNVELSQHSQASKNQISKCSNLINQGGRKHHKYSDLCKEVMTIISTRLKSDNLSGFNAIMIESSLSRLKYICEQNDLQFPHNIYAKPVGSSPEIDEAIAELKNERRGFKFPLKLGQIVFILIVILVLILPFIL